MNIFIEDYSGESTAIEVQPSYKVQDVKDLMGAGESTLSYEGLNLENDELIMDYGIVGDCILCITVSEQFLLKKKLFDDYGLFACQESMNKSVANEWTEVIKILYKLSFRHHLIYPVKPIKILSFETLLLLGYRENLDQTLDTCIKFAAVFHLRRLIDICNIQPTKDNYRWLTHNATDDDSCVLIKLLYNSVSHKQEFIDYICRERKESKVFLRSLFYSFVMAGKFKAAQLIIDMGKPSYSETDEQGRYSWFHLTSHLSIPQSIWKEINYSLRDSCGRTCLYFFIVYHSGFSRNAAIHVKSLIDSGSDVNASDSKGLTSLHMARDVSVISILIQNGANVNAVCNKGRSPLYNHIVYGTVEGLILLLKNKADPNLPDAWGKTAVHHACTHGKTVSLLLLLRFGGSVEALDENLKTPIFHSICHRRWETTAYIINKGADLTVLDKTGRQPLSHAIQDGQDTIMNYNLAETGFDLVVDRLLSQE